MTLPIQAAGNWRSPFICFVKHKQSIVTLFIKYQKETIHQHTMIIIFCHSK